MTTREERAEWREWLTYPGGADDDNAPLTRGEARRLLDALDAREVEIALFSAALDQAAEDRDDLTAAIERVRALAEEWRYKGEHGHGPWQAGSGPSPDGEALDWASSLILRALDGGE